MLLFASSVEIHLKEKHKSFVAKGKKALKVLIIIICDLNRNKSNTNHSYWRLSNDLCLHKIEK